MRVRKLLADDAAADEAYGIGIRGVTPKS